MEPSRTRMSGHFTHCTLHVLCVCLSVCLFHVCCAKLRNTMSEKPRKTGNKDWICQAVVIISEVKRSRCYNAHKGGHVMPF